MRRTGKTAWRAVFLTYPCPTCGQAPGQWCRTRSGKPAELPHMARGRVGVRCPVCHALLDDGAEHGDLCPRCQLVRALEVERATTWPRRDP
jgi:hypothetical protein